MVKMGFSRNLIVNSINENVLNHASASYNIFAMP